MFDKAQIYIFYLSSAARTRQTDHSANKAKLMNLISIWLCPYCGHTCSPVRCFTRALHWSQGEPDEHVEMAQHKSFAAAFLVPHYCFKSANIQMVLAAFTLYSSARREPSCCRSCSPLSHPPFSLCLRHSHHLPLLSLVPISIYLLYTVLHDVTISGSWFMYLCFTAPESNKNQIFPLVFHQRLASG